MIETETVMSMSSCLYYALKRLKTHHLKIYRNYSVSVCRTSTQSSALYSTYFNNTDFHLW